jgi:hypothetical protein
MIETLNFGKYNGKSLPWLALHDPDYFFWLLEENILERYPLLQPKANELAIKAKSIKLPMSDAQDWCVVYISYRGALAGVQTVPKTSLGNYQCNYWSDHIDLSLARNWKHYDKFGGRVLIKAVKKLYFNDEEARLTEKRCREFFANPDNFVLEIESVIETKNLMLHI